MTSQIEEEDLFDNGEDDFDMNFDDVRIPKSKQRGALYERADSPSDELVIDEDAFVRSMSQFSQRSQRGAMPCGTGTGGRPLYEEHSVAPKNDFEKYLLQSGCVLHTDENSETYIHLGKHLNHSAFVQHLQKDLSNSSKRDKIISDLELAIVESSRNLKLYLTPTQSSLGRQDTIYRAFLLCSHTQTRSFDLLMAHMGILAKSDESGTEDLALSCVAQIRYLDCVFDCYSIMRAILCRNIEDWKAKSRDELIRAIPEVIPDVSCHEEVAQALMEMMLRDPPHDPASFRSAILATLQLLRMSSAVSKEICSLLTKNVMRFDAASVPQLVLLCLDCIDGRDKTGLLTVLNDLSANLQIERMKLRSTGSRMSLDDVVCEIFGKIARFLQITGNKHWKDVTAFLKGVHSKESSSDVDNDADQQSQQQSQQDADIRDIDVDEKKLKEYGLFDVLLSFAIMDLECCPPAVQNTMKSQIVVAEDPARLFQTFKSAFCYKKFISTHLVSVMAMCRNLIWSTDGAVRRLGSVLYTECFVAVEKKRPEIFAKMLSGLGTMDTETAAILSAIEILVDNHMQRLTPFVAELQKCMDLIEVLSVENTCKLLSLLISIYTKDTKHLRLKFAVEETLSFFAKGITERERLWAVIGVLMQMRSDLVGRSPYREENLRTQLKTFGEIACSSPRLRAIGYRQLTQILKGKMQIQPSDALVHWAERLLAGFRREFFEERAENYIGDTDLEDPKFLTSPTLWLKPPPERLAECVPLFELLKEVSFLRQRWEEDDTQLAEKNHWKLFEFAFEANVSMGGLEVADRRPSDLQEVATSLYHVIQWLRMLLNTFASSPERTVGPTKAEIMSKKFQLLVEAQKYIVYAVNELHEWAVPSASLRERKTVVVGDRARATVKRPSKPAKTNGKRKKKTGAEEPVSAFSQPAVVDAVVVAVEDPDDEPSSENKGKDSNSRTNCRTVPVADVQSCYIPLQLCAVVKLLKALPTKRHYTRILLDQLFRIIVVVLPKREKKIAPWMDSTALDPSKQHGDAAQIWKLTISALSVVVLVICKSAKYIVEELNRSIVAEGQPVANENMILLMTAALKVLVAVLSCKEVNGTITQQGRQREHKRQNLMQVLEKNIVDHSKGRISSSQNEDAEVAVLKFVDYLCESAPSAEIASLLLEATSPIEICDDALRNSLALHALNYLRREWSDAEGKLLKGSALTNPVKSIIEHYLRLRSDDHRLLAVEWLAATKMSDLVPSERRKSTSASDVRDPLLTNGEEGQTFASINRVTLPVCYRVLFSTLNSECSRGFALPGVVTSRQMSPTECIAQWEMASACFMLLCVILRVGALRSNSVLTTACREGKRFVALLVKNSSFITILENEQMFKTVTPRVAKVLKAVQLGNRTLQNISVFAKSSKASSLLRMLPELRAANELLMRSVHSVVVRLGCEDAFSVGLLKSRDLDGEEIPDEDEDMPEQTEENNGEEEGQEHEDQDSRMSEVY